MNGGYAERVFEILFLHCRDVHIYAGETVSCMPRT